MKMSVNKNLRGMLAVYGPNLSWSDFHFETDPFSQIKLKHFNGTFEIKRINFQMFKDITPLSNLKYSYIYVEYQLSDSSSFDHTEDFYPVLMGLLELPPAHDDLYKRELLRNKFESSRRVFQYSLNTSKTLYKKCLLMTINAEHEGKYAKQIAEELIREYSKLL